MRDDGFSVLRIRQSGPAGNDAEISLDGVPLRDVVSVDLHIDGLSITRATLTLEVIADVETPCEVL